MEVFAVECGESSTSEEETLPADGEPLDVDEEIAAPYSSEIADAAAHTAEDEDQLQIEDDALIVAAIAAPPTFAKRVAERRAMATAFSLALLIHLAAGAVCFALALTARIWLPRLDFTKGAGTSESGLVSDKSNQTESQDAGVPGPVVAMPDPPQPMPVENRPAANDAVADPDPTSMQRSTLTSADPEPEQLDSVTVGVVVDAIGPTPTWHHPTQAAAPTPQVGATVNAASAGTGASTPSPRAQGATARHSFVAPRGAGHPGRGDEGSGFDSLGLPVPEYPPESKRRHEEGTVEVEVQVQADGSVAAAQIVKDSGYPRLNQAALIAIRAARFTPALTDGMPVAARVIVPFRFILR